MRWVDEPFPLSSLLPRTTASFPKSHKHSGLLPGLSPRAGDGHESCQESLLSRSLRRYQRLPHTGSEICVTTFFPSASLSWLRRVEGIGEGDVEGEEVEDEGRRGGAWAWTLTQPILHPPHDHTSMEKGEGKEFWEQCVVKAVVSDPRAPDPVEPVLNSLGKIREHPSCKDISIHMGVCTNEESFCKDVGWTSRTPRGLTPPWCQADPSQGRGKLQPAGKTLMWKISQLDQITAELLGPQQCICGCELCAASHWVSAVATFLKLWAYNPGL